MLKKMRIGAAAVLFAASLATGAGTVAASAATSQGHGAISHSQSAAWALLILQREARAHAQMTKAGVGPSLAGNL